jgi:hypothetical protein
MFDKIVQFLKRLLPRSLKQKIKDSLGLNGENLMLTNKVEIDHAMINIAINCGGGIGDFIVYKSIFDQLCDYGNCCLYIFTLSYVNANLILKDLRYVHIYYPFYAINDKDFDLHLRIDHHIEIEEHHATKIKRIAPKLYDAIGLIKKINDKNNNGNNYFLIQRNAIIFRAKILGLNRWTTLAYNTVFDMKSMRSNICINEEISNILNKYDLYPKRYIAIHYGADKDMGGTKQVKVWPRSKYSQLVTVIKDTYPNIPVVQISAGAETGISGVDILIKNENLEDVKIVLKNAITLVASEGGMVHLATQFETRCVVLFGPTPVHYYGYPTNINIIATACKECMEVTEDWATECVRYFETPICMESIDAEVVMEAVKEVIEEYEQSNIS